MDGREYTEPELNEYGGFAELTEGSGDDASDALGVGS